MLRQDPHPLEERQLQELSGWYRLWCRIDETHDDSLEQTRGETAVEGQAGATTERRLLAGEEQDGLGDFLDRAVAALLLSDEVDKPAGREAQRGFELGSPVVDQIGADESGKDGVDPDPERSELDGGSLGQVDHGGLGRGIRGDQR